MLMRIVSLVGAHMKYLFSEKDVKRIRHNHFHLLPELTSNITLTQDNMLIIDSLGLSSHFGSCLSVTSIICYDNNIMTLFLLISLIQNEEA